jgi:hypothetical protein
MGKPEGKKPLGRHELTGKIILIRLKEIEWEGVDWIEIAQDKDKQPDFVTMIVNFGFHTMPAVS